MPGRSRACAIAEGRRRGYRRFWIARCRRMTAAERELSEGTCIVDPATEELITPRTF